MCQAKHEDCSVSMEVEKKKKAFIVIKLTYSIA